MKEPNIKSKGNLKETILSWSWKVWVVLGLMFLTILYGLLFVEAVYSGETYTYNTNIKNLTWIVTGNSSNLDGLNISQLNNQIIISVDILFKPDNFTITFYDNQEEVITYSHGGSNKKWIPSSYIPENKTYTTDENEVEDNVPQEIEDLPLEKSNLLFWIGLMVVVTILVVVISILSRKKEDTLPDFKSLDELNKGEEDG